MEFGVQNVNANLFSDNKCIETENAWFWEMLNLVRIWHENALFSALHSAVMQACQWDMSWVSMWHLEEIFEEIEGIQNLVTTFWWSLWGMTGSSRRCQNAFKVALNFRHQRVKCGLSFILHFNIPAPLCNVDYCIVSQPSEWLFHLVSHWNFTGSQEAFQSVKFGKIDPKFSLKIQFHRSS